MTFLTFLNPVLVACLHLEFLQDAQVLTYESMKVGTALSRVEEDLNQVDVDSLMKIEQFCPNGITSVVLNNTEIVAAVNDILQTYEEVSVHVNRDNIEEANTDLAEVLTGSEEVKDLLQWFEGNDWQPKMFVLFYCTFTIFLMVGAWCARNNMGGPPLRFMLAYFILPAFLITLMGGLIATCGVAVVTIMNAGE